MNGAGVEIIKGNVPFFTFSIPIIEAGLYVSLITSTY